MGCFRTRCPGCGCRSVALPAEERVQEWLSYSCPLAVPSQELRPRLCHIKKGPNGYGFNLHSDKSRPGQYIRAIDPGLPAEAAGLRPQDRIIEVGDGAGGCLGSPKLGMGLPETRGVTNRAAQHGGARELPFWGTVTQGRAVATQGCSRALIHPLGDKLQSPSLSPRGARLSLGCPRVGRAGQVTNAPRGSWAVRGDQGGGEALGSLGTTCRSPIPARAPCSCQHGRCNPVLITRRKSAFNEVFLPANPHTSPDVNGASVEGKQHASVVAAIKEGGDETKLLVVDVLTDEFFKKCKVVPSEAHLEGFGAGRRSGMGDWVQGVAQGGGRGQGEPVRQHPCPLPTGPLPEPVANGDIEKENSEELRSNSASERSPSPMLATSPDGSETRSEPGVPEGDKRSSASGSLLDLDIPLAVAKERAHQKRTSKRAPQMDWSKKNELFSNL
ncbi:Na(+)/H(+) exchange regulatory cofactor NHE-RF1-like protein [Aix galericulata]|nr:Na(+)/H(+) exchange regulatory cofactor NHE-RF1-like protein [Aix galericulata]